MVLAETTVVVTADTDALRRDLRSSANTAGQRAGRALADGMNEGFDDGVRLDAQGRLRDARGRFVRAGRRSGEDTGEAFSDGFRRALNFEAARRSLSALTAPLRGLAAGIGLGVLAVQAAAASQAVAALGASLVPLAGLVAGVPAGVAVFSAALGTLTVALSGTGDAMDALISGEMDDFEEALAGLAPAAQDVFRELQALRPAFAGLRQTVQGEFFGPLVGQMGQLAVLVGPLTQGMSQVAAAMGRVAAALVAVGTESASLSAINTLGTVTAQVIDGMAAAVGPLARGFRDVAVAALPFFERLGPLIRDAGTAFGEFLTDAAGSGAVASAFSGALDVLRQLGSVAQDVGGILAGVFRAANAAGSGNALGVFASALDSLNDFVASPAGQGALTQIFQTLGAIGSGLGDVLGTLVTELGGIAPALAGIAASLAPVLQTVVRGLGGALQGLLPAVIPIVDALGEAFEALEPVMEPLGRAIGDVVAALAPLLPPIGEIVAEIGTALIPVIEDLKPIIDELVGVALANFATMLPELRPLLRDVTRALGDWLTAISPLIGPLLQVFIVLQRWLLIRPIIGLVRGLSLAISFFAQIMTPVTIAIGALVTGLLNFNLVLQQAQIIITAFTTAVSTVFSQMWARVTFITNTSIGILVEAFGGIPGRVLAALSSLIGLVAGFFSQVWNAAVNATLGGVGRLMGVIGSIPGRIRGFVGAFTSAGAALIGGLLSGLRSISQGALSSLGATIVGAVRAGINSGISSINSFIDTVNSKIPGGSPVPHIPTLAQGGLIDSPTLAIVGEAGQEVVVPITRGPRAVDVLAAHVPPSQLAAALGATAGSPGRAGASTTYEIHVHTNHIDPEAVGRKVLQMIAGTGQVGYV